MAAVNKVFAARLAGLVVLGPDGESIGRVRDVVLTIRIGRQPPRVLGLVIEMFTRKRIFVPMLRVTAIEPASVTLKTGNVSLRRFDQRPTEILALAQVLDSRVRIDDPEVTEAIGTEAVIVDLGIELTRTRDWVVSRVAVRAQRGRLGRRSAIHVVDWQHVHGLTPTALSMPGQGVSQLLMQFEACAPPTSRTRCGNCPRSDGTRWLSRSTTNDWRTSSRNCRRTTRPTCCLHLEVERAADVLEAMDPDDAADLLGELPETDAESLLQLMDPEDSEPVRRLLEHSPDTAGGLMTPEPVVLTPSTTVAEALARARNADLTPALASMVFVVRPPTATPTGRYLGCVHLQRLLREPPANLVGGVLDDDLPRLDPEDSLATVTRFFATYNLVCAPVVDDEHHLLGAVTVDDVLDHLLPTDWREEDHNHE